MLVVRAQGLDTDIVFEDAPEGLLVVFRRGVSHDGKLYTQDDDVSCSARVHSAVPHLEGGFPESVLVLSAVPVCGRWLRGSHEDCAPAHVQQFAQG